MSEKKKKKYTKIGAVWQGQYGPFLVLGQTKSKVSKYNYDILVRMQTPEGEKLIQVKNPLLNLKDPRSYNNQESRQVPEGLLFDVSVVEEQEE